MMFFISIIMVSLFDFVPSFLGVFINRKVQHGDRKSKNAKISCLSFSPISSLTFSRPMTNGRVNKNCFFLLTKSRSFCFTLVKAPPSPKCDTSEPEFFVRLLVFFRISVSLWKTNCSIEILIDNTHGKLRKITFCYLRLNCDYL